MFIENKVPVWTDLCTGSDLIFKKVVGAIAEKPAADFNHGPRRIVQFDPVRIAARRVGKQFVDNDIARVREDAAIIVSG